MKRVILSAAASLMILAGCHSEPVVSKSAMTRPAVAVSAVKVYTEQPKKYEWIDWVEVKGQVKYGPDQSVEAVVEDLRSQAAKLGANGLLLMTDKSKDMILSSGSYGGKPLSVPVRVRPEPAVVGQAIFVTQ